MFHVERLRFPFTLRHRLRCVYRILSLRCDFLGGFKQGG